MISPTIGEYIINETTQRFIMIRPMIGEYIINLNHWSYVQEHYPYCTKILIKIIIKKKPQLFVMISFTISRYITNPIMFDVQYCFIVVKSFKIFADNKNFGIN